MRFALLGADPEVLGLARAVATHPQHRLVWAGALGSAASEVARFAPQARIDDNWETLLVDDQIDAILVASVPDDEAAVDRLRKVVQLGKPLLISHPVHPSMLVCYELDMIQQESHAVLVPYEPARWHPATQRLAALFGGDARASLGQLEQVLIERRLTDRSPESVRQAFARDADVARCLAGELTRLSAMAPTHEPSGYGSLGIQLSGPANVLVRYSVLPVERAPQGRITAIGSAGKAVLTMPDQGAWTLEQADGNPEDPESFADWDPAAAALERFVRAVEGDNIVPSWGDACREVELADSIQRSLHKGRTVEFHFEDYTQDGTFKGQMTSLGCALIWMAPLVIVVGIVLGRLGWPIADYVPHLLLGVLGLFLLLQLLRLAVPDKSN